jgi:hypothetical protein
MRSHRIVVLPPSIDDGLGFLQRVEYLAIEQFVTKLDTSKNHPIPAVS